VLSEASVALPPGPTSALDIFASVALLALTGLFYIVTRTRRLQPYAVAVPLCYVASTLWLILGVGGSTSGVGLLVLLPIMWAALNLEFVPSLAVVLAVVVVEFVTTVVPVDLTDTVRLRRELSFLFIGVLIVVTVRDLRVRIRRSNVRRDSRDTELLRAFGELSERSRISTVLTDLVDILNFCNAVEEAYEVFDYAARQIFVDGGSISILSPSSNLMTVQCSWPLARGTQTPFLADQCIAVQQSQPYDSLAGGQRCAHLAPSAKATRCHPMFINREMVGLLSVVIPGDMETASFDVADQYRRYARQLCDQISIWLANFRLRESLKKLSIRDPLTNLFNRRFMIETLHREIAITTRNDDETSIMQIDIDYFKEFNDSFGHDVGDAVLEAVAGVMLGLFRESDVPCRSGGEEFTLILPRCSWEIAHQRATELQARVAQVVIAVPENQARPKPPTLSIGIATSPANGCTSDDLLRSADAAMYSAKSAGRNRIARASAPQLA
jgi:diguanylate cyclase (GGDEF)-like protein